MTKDKQIIAQSQLKMAHDWSQACGYCLTLKDLVSVSVVLSEYCEKGYSKDLGQRLEKVDDYLFREYGKNHQ